MKNLRIHCLQHVEFEGPGYIQDWAFENGHSLSFTRFFENEELPELDSFDLLVVMGGPMSFDDDEIYEWMPKEKSFLKEALDANKMALGICLGAQLLSIALGAEGKHGTEQEVGWFPIQFINTESSFSFLPPSATVFHWHGDTFEIPETAIRIAETPLFPNQGFIFENRIVAMQFHLEVTPRSVQAMIDHVGHLIPKETYTQKADHILDDTRWYAQNKQFLYKILDQLTSREI